MVILTIKIGIDMEFYKEKLHEIIEKDKITLRKLAKLMGISHATISLWLAGKSVPRERNIYMMARVLNISVKEISDLEDIEDINAEVSGYFQGWGTSLNKDKQELEDPCIKAMKQIENIKNEQYRLRSVIRAFMLTSHSMLYAKNYHGDYIVANEHYLKAIGLNTNINIIGKKDSDIMSRKTAVKNSTQDLSIINTGKPIVKKSFKFPFPNSKIKYCIMSKVPLRDSKQNIVGIVASFTDITETEKIRRHDKMMIEAIKQCDSAIGITRIISSDKRTFVFANESLNKILGFNANALNEDMNRINECILEEDKAKMDEYIASYKKNFRKTTVKYKHPVTSEVKYLTFKSTKVKDSNLYYHWVYDDTEKYKNSKE